MISNLLLYSQIDLTQTSYFLDSLWFRTPYLVIQDSISLFTWLVHGSLHEMMTNGLNFMQKTARNRENEYVKVPQVVDMYVNRNISKINKRIRAITSTTKPISMTSNQIHLTWMSCFKLHFKLGLTAPIRPTCFDWYTVNSPEPLKQIHCIFCPAIWNSSNLDVLFQSTFQVRIHCTHICPTLFDWYTVNSPESLKQIYCIFLSSSLKFIWLGCPVF